MAVPAGTVRSTRPVRPDGAGFAGSKRPLGSAVSDSGLTVSASSPAPLTLNVPVYPARSGMAVLPVAPVPVTSAGAATATDCTAIGLVTALPSKPRQVSEPKPYEPNPAVVRVTVTVNVAVPLGRTTIAGGSTLTLYPAGALTSA